MSEEENKKTVEEEVLKAIRERRVCMRSKKYFALQAALLASGVTILFLAVLYLASFVIFEVFETGVWFAPVPGLDGWILFFRSLPWLLILFVFVFMLILEVMVRKYSFAYRRPLLYSMLGIVGLAVVGGFLISRADFHNQFRDFARDHRIRGVGRFYRDFGAPRMQEVRKGVIEEVVPGGFLVRTRRGETSTILITSSTRMSEGGAFMIRDMVIIFGPESSGTVQAVGVRRLPPR